MRNWKGAPAGFLCSSVAFNSQFSIPNSQFPVLSVDWAYSVLSATVGWTRVARRAGR